MGLTFSLGAAAAARTLTAAPPGLGVLVALVRRGEARRPLSSLNLTSILGF